MGLDQMLLESLSYTLLVSGVDSTPQEVYENVVSRCRENVQNVIKEALVAREAIKVNVASRDFEVMAPKYGANFDSENMEASSKPHNQGSRPDKVFCVTDIGLVRRQTVDGGQPGVVEFSEQIIVPLKAKVILQSEIMEMVGIGPSDSTAEDGSRRE